MEEKYESHDIYVIANQLTAIGGLMMGLDGDAVELLVSETRALGKILKQTGNELNAWNKEAAMRCVDG